MTEEKTPVRALCDQYGLTQAALAQRFGIPLRTVEQWCTGRRQAPDYVVGMMKQILESAPVVHARWIVWDGDPMWRECSACGYRIQYILSKDCKFCPQCGATMDLEEEQHA